MQRPTVKWSILQLRRELKCRSIKYQSISKQMGNQGLSEAKGICSVCAGHINGNCYCHTLIISDDDCPCHLLVADDSSHHHEFISTKEESSTGPTITHQTYHRKRKDNIAHKRFSTILRKIYKRLGKDIDELLFVYYHRKDFFVMILNLLEREGQLEEAMKDFELEMTCLTQKISNEMQEEEPDYLKYLIQLIKDHQKAFGLFKGGDWRGALETLFHPQEMRQRGNFAKSVKKIEEMRKDMGLPF